MNTYAIPSSAHHQRGAVSVAIAMLLVFILMAAVAASMNISGSSVVDSASSEAQTAALFLAESGVERAQATISGAAQGGGYTNTTCTNLTSAGAQSLGRGAFTYVSASSTPTACGGTNPSCTGCAVTVMGTVGSSSRIIRTQLTTAITQGVEGHGHNFTLNMNPTVNNTAVITNLAYRAKDGGGSNASVSTCTSGSSGSINSCTNGWNLVGTGTNNVSGMGVYASVPAAGTYSITDTLSADRNYVQTGALFYPTTGGSVSLVGVYSSNTGSNKTVGTSATSSTVPYDWNCAPSSGTNTDVSVTAGADTLVYGFSSWPVNATNQLNGTAFGNIPLRRILNMTGTQGDSLYSQIWYTYNAPYYPGPGASISNGATFTGTLGASFKGHTVTNSSNSNCPTGSTCLLLDQNVGTNQILSTGDTIVGTGCSSITCTLGTLKAGNSGQTNALYTLTYSGSTAPNITNNTSLTSQSNVLNVVSITAGTTLTTGDKITDTGETIAYGYLPTVSFPITTPATYALLDASGNSAAKTQVASTTLYSSGNTITVSGSLSGSYTTPTVGTAVEVPTAANTSYGSFSSATFTGSISGTTLTVNTVSAGSLKVGDALYGVNIQPQTRITAFGSGSGGTGTYTVTPSQETVSNTIVAKAAVVSGSATSFVVSRPPSQHISGASICGGLCALMFPVVSRTITFSLSNLTTGDDWASGFACLRGVDPNNIKVLGTIVARRTAWGEPIQ